MNNLEVEPNWNEQSAFKQPHMPKGAESGRRTPVDHSAAYLRLAELELEIGRLQSMYHEASTMVADIYLASNKFKKNYYMVAADQLEELIEFTGVKNMLEHHK
jgi:hypothetical protein